MLDTGRWWPIACPETSVTINLHYVISKKSEDLRWNIVPVVAGNRDEIKIALRLLFNIVFMND